MPISLTRTVGFHARHHLRVAAWDEARNRRQFGQLTEAHDHDYTCSVTVSGPADPQGMIMDLALLDRILEEEVRRPLDGSDLNRDIPTFATGHPLPTCEALAAFLFRRVAPRLPAGVRLDRLSVAEDATLQADCSGVD
jgi:6-pyruvoyltetrahydropterin/6-carboxytetrahydropterin synthase